MPYPNIVEAGRATRFKKGNVPKSPGRPRKTAVSDAYAKHVGKPLPEDVRLKLRLPEGSTWVDAMAVGQIRSAVKGKPEAAREIREGIEGKALIRQEIVGGHDGEGVFHVVYDED